SVDGLWLTCDRPCVNSRRLNTSTDLGDFSNVSTETTNSLGTAHISFQSGFPDNTLATGFFSLSGPANAAALASLFASIVSTQQIQFGVFDNDFNIIQFYDFAQGVDGSLTDVGQPPTVVAITPEPTSVVVFGTVLAACAGAAWRRRRLAAVVTP